MFKITADLGQYVSFDIITTQSAKALFDSQVSNMTTAVIRGNYKCVFTGGSLKEEFFLYNKFWYQHITKKADHLMRVV